MKPFLILCAGLMLSACQAPAVPSIPSNADTRPFAVSPVEPPGSETSCLLLGYVKGETFQVQQFRINCQRNEVVPVEVLILDQKTQAALEGVKVTVHVEEKGVWEAVGSSALSNAQGRYDFSLGQTLADSNVRLTLEKNGYKMLEQLLGYRGKYSTTKPEAATSLQLKLEPVS